MEPFSQSKHDVLCFSSAVFCVCVCWRGCVWVWRRFRAQFSSCMPPPSICCTSVSVSVFLYAAKWASTSWSVPILRANVQSETKPASPSVIGCPARSPWTRARGLLGITNSYTLFSYINKCYQTCQDIQGKDLWRRDTQREILFVLFHWMKYRYFDITLRYSCPVLFELARGN